MRALLLVFVILSSVTLPASAQTTIDTGDPIDLASGVSGWEVGHDSYSRFYYAGQSFIAPNLTAVAMSSFSFGICCSYEVVYEPYFLRAWVAEFDGAAITNILHFGEANSFILPGLPGLVSNPNEPRTWWMTWDIGGAGISLVAGRQYLAFVGVDPTRPFSLPGNPGVIDTRTDRYAEGSGFTHQYGPMGALPIGEPLWHDTQTDVMFSGEFTGGQVVPEPSTVILLGTGLLGLGVVAWRRREREV